MVAVVEEVVVDVVVEVKMKKIWFVGIFVLILLSVGVFTKGFGVFGNEEVEIPLDEITEEARWYEEEIKGVTVKFFAIRDGDDVKTAFDACDVCYRSNKGYSQDGDFMVCNNCGNKYAISGLGTKNKAGGGCWPGYLPSEVKGDKLVIKESDLEKGKYRFK